MKIFLSVFFLFVTIPDAAVAGPAGALDELNGISPYAAHENAPASPSPGTASKYETLKQLFESGRPATDSELSNWYSGRYVGRSAPDTFYGSIMIGFPSSAEGPLFPSKFWIALPRQSADPTYYDSLTPAKLAAIRASLNQNKLRLTFPQAKGTYVYSDGTSLVVYDMEYRRCGDYIVEKMGDTQPGAGYTYYFINVTPKK